MCFKNRLGSLFYLSFSYKMDIPETISQGLLSLNKYYFFIIIQK